MRLPIITRKEYEVKIIALETRIRDLERHFVTKCDEAGNVTETLADIPVEKRDLKRPLRGMNWDQRRRWLEQESARKAGVVVP
jgi:hypothetical protein